MESYITQCVNAGILTEEKIKSYKLKPGSLAVILKVYALYNKIPFVFNAQTFAEYKNYNLFLTDEGYVWLINEFKKYTLSFLRSTFSHIFLRLNDLNKLESYNGLNNFKGISGTNYKAGTKSSAVLLRKQGARVHELFFTTLAEARKEVINLTRFYPVEDFNLYLVTNSKGVYYRQKVPLILESNRRGVPVNLPHLKGKL
jgi:hypothetical protein